MDQFLQSATDVSLAVWSCMNDDESHIISCSIGKYLNLLPQASKKTKSLGDAIENPSFIKRLENVGISKQIFRIQRNPPRTHGATLRGELV